MKPYRNIIPWLVIAILLVFLFYLFQGPAERQTANSISYSQFLAETEAGSVRDVTISGESIFGHFGDGRTFTTYAPYDPDLVQRLDARGVNISATPSLDEEGSFFNLLISWFPMLLLVAVYIFFMRQMQGGNGRAMGFGKSRAKLLTQDTNRVTLRMSPVWTKPRRNCRRSSNFCAIRKSFSVLAGIFPKACCWSALRAPAKR
ncbi:MAG: cell division protease FtsH [Alphaproteobacteria bacterium]|nr:cell division protease FtsH [Alphaproteobacteria bacterium]